MSNPELHHKITYIEFTTTDIAKTKKFYSTVFGWSFKDWGPDYIDSNVADAGIAIGFAKGAAQQEQPKFAPFVVLYSKDLKATEAAIVDAGRQPRARSMDLLIAATAHAHSARLYTRNAGDFDGLNDLLEVVAV